MPRLIRSWYQTSLGAIRHALIRLGADWLIDPEETHDFYKQEWSNRDAMLAELFPISPQALEEARVLVYGGDVTISQEWLGHGDLWWPPPSHLAGPGLDEEEFGWITSRTDEAWWSNSGRRRK